MNQAITVKILSCTNHKPTRLKARCAGGSLIVSYDEATSKTGTSLLAPQYAAQRLADKMNWKYKLKGGVDFRGDSVFILS